MEIIKIGENNSKKIRIVKDKYEVTDADNRYNHPIFVCSYLVQIKFLFIWLTIKHYTYSYDVDSNISKVTIDVEQHYRKTCAEELFDHLTRTE